MDFFSHPRMMKIIGTGNKRPLLSVAVCGIFENDVHDEHVYIGAIILELLLIARQPSGIISRKK